VNAPASWQQDVDFWLNVWDSIQCHLIAGGSLAAVMVVERVAYQRLTDLMARRP
jgi:hypothetical protein